MRKTWYFVLLAFLCSCAGSRNRQIESKTPLPIGIHEGRISLANTVEGNTTFRIAQRAKDNHAWEGEKVYPLTNGIILLRALEGAKPWDGTSGASAYGISHAQAPSTSVSLDWSRNEAERKARFISLCYGNRLFWYWGSVWQVPEKAWDLVDTLFPRINNGQ